MFAVSAEGMRFSPAGSERDDVTGNLGEHRLIDWRQGEHRRPRQGGTEAEDRTYGMNETDPQRVNSAQGRSLQYEGANDVQSDQSCQDLFADSVGGLAA